MAVPEAILIASAQRSRQDRLFVAAWCLLGMALAFRLYLGVFRVPVSWDEGQIVTVPGLISSGHGYAMGNMFGRLIPFNPGITTGAPVVFPITGVFLLFGDSLEAARSVMALGFLGVMAVSAELGRRIAGRWGALCGAASALAYPINGGGRDQVDYGVAAVMGEYVAGGLVILSALLLARRPLISGSVLALATLTKLMAAVFAPWFVFALAAIPLTSRRRGIVRFVVGYALAMLAWETYKLVALGPAGYVASWKDYVNFIGIAGSGVAGVTFPDSHRADPVRVALMANWIPAVLVGVLICGMLWLLPSVRRAQTTDEAQPELSRGLRQALLALCAGGFMLTLWWFTLSTQPFMRHVLIAFLACLPIGCCYLIRQSRTHSATLVRSGVPLAVALSLAVSIALGNMSYWHKRGGLALQRQAAAAIRSSGADHIQYPDSRGRNTIPTELRYLSGTTLATWNTPHSITVLSRWDHGRVPEADVREVCADVLFDDVYVVCWAKPGLTADVLTEHAGSH